MNQESSYFYRTVAFTFIVGLLYVTNSCASKSNETSSSITPSQSPAQDVAQAQQLYTQREDLTKVRQGVVALRQAVTVDPGNYEAQWLLAKFNYYLATHTDDTSERDNAFREGIAAGKNATLLQNDKPDGHFWLGANYGAAAQHSTIEGLATVDDIRGEMEKVIQLNEGYQDGSAYMVLGLVYLNAPGFVGGDPKKAVELMEKGLRFGEPNAFLHLHLAEAYAKVDRTEDARKQINTILSMRPDQNYLPEYKEAAEEARKLQEKLSA
jgi:Tfp pilus assembly protein PilF